eukprot:1214074-Prorocentrum_lima.AAC.1
MEFDYSVPGQVKISMKAMVEQVLQDYDDVTHRAAATTPATFNLFQVSQQEVGEVEEGRGEVILLSKTRREKFHSTVQKLLYMSKKARPDILTSVAFLTTRVLRPTYEDEKKLKRLLSYLHGTRELGLTLCGSKGMTITSFIDASYAINNDGKGQTGVVISVGKGAIYSRSSKQKIVAKSSTEAELIGVSDGLSQVIWTQHFLHEQGFGKGGPAVLYQDNKSTIVLAERGRSNAGRTRHVAIRYFFVKDKIDNNEVKIKYLPTDKMIADFYTKPLQG